MVDSKSYLEGWQIDKIISNTDNKSMQVLFFILARTGRRISEVLNELKPRDIDFTNGWIDWMIEKRFHTLKRGGVEVVTRHREILGADPKILVVLKKYIEDYKIESDQPIFQMSRQQADKYFKRAAELSGIIHVGNNERNKPHLHLLRHSFAIAYSKKLSSPADLIKLQRMMGHAKLDTTSHYLHYNIQEEKKILESMWKKD